MTGGGVVVWITGLPSAGKSTFARALRAELAATSAPTCVLDSDEVRAALVPALGYSEEARASFYQALARLCALLAQQGLVVLVPATAHRRTFRLQARELAPAFVEVFVNTPIAECRERDTKGLYAAAAAGRAHHVPGVSSPYEAPSDAEVVAAGGEDRSAVEDALRRILRIRSS